MKNKQSLALDENVGNYSNEQKDSQESKKLLVNRLSRIIGQINAVKVMVENDRYPADILIQVSAATAALNSFSRELFQKYVSEDVCEKLKNDDSEILDEFLVLLKKMIS